MPVNHSLEVILKKDGSGGGFGGATSPVKNLKDMTQKVGTFGSFYEKFDSLQGITSKSNTKELLGVAGSMALQGAKVVTAFADTGINVLFDIDYAITNEKIAYNNRKKTKNYIFNPLDFVFDMTYGRWIGQIGIDRRNIENDRARDLSGNIVIGNQFGIKR